MAAGEKKIYVYENWSSEIPRELGILYVSNVRGTETFSFEYNEEYLKNPVSCSIDPDLELFQGRQFTYQKPNFGIFSDSAPDRWGRTLMDRRERFRAKEEGRKPRTLLTSDYKKRCKTKRGSYRTLEKNRFQYGGFQHRRSPQKPRFYPFQKRLEAFSCLRYKPESCRRGTCAECQRKR